MSITLGNLDLSSLSVILGISSQKILKLSKIAPILYREVSISKKNGKTRKIEIPEQRLKKAQKIILHEILNKLPIHHLIFGGLVHLQKRRLYYILESTF